MLHFLRKWLSGLNQKKAVAAPKSVGTKTKFYLNDPTTPDLILEQDPPVNTSFAMKSVGDQGGGFALGTSQQQASACKIMVNNVLSYMLVSYRLASSAKKLTGWAATSSLTINSRAGVDINAYYDRSSLKFFYFQNRAKKKTVYTADSNSVVCHEFGHALLDSIRPDFWSTQSTEVWAYHEAFGDMTALIASLQYDDLINRALIETKGNLMLSNVLTRLAAEMGTGLYDVSRDKTGMLKTCLRDLSIVYNYVKPETLSDSTPDNVLSNECHSFSRVFSGAFYEMFVKIAEQNIATGKSAIDSIKISRDVVSRYLLKATSTVPLTVRLFDAMARQIIQIDKSEGGKYQTVISDLFTRRNILLSKVLMLNDMDFSSVKAIVKDPYEIQLLDNNKMLRTFSNKTIKLSEIDGVSALNNNPLLSLEIEVPSQKGYYFDENNKLFDIIDTTDEEAIESAYSCVEFLNSNHLVGNYRTSLFEIKKGKLVRKQMVCKCGLPNYCDPNAPEYQKPWKPANNSSCSACQGTKCLPRSCDCSQPEQLPKRKTSCYSALKSCMGKTYKIGQAISRGVCSN